MVDEVVAFLKVLADPTRMKLAKLLLDQELCVCELPPLLGISQPAVSQHIARLKAAGLLQERRAGTWTYYRVDRGRLAGALDGVKAWFDADATALPEIAPLVDRRNGLGLCCDAGEEGKK
ncbi:MAG: ArsR/SmtB family transcription factor [Mycobacterium leprae]